MNASNGSRRAFMLVCAVFVLGIALGSLGMYVFSTRVHAARSQVDHNPANTSAMFTRDLGLNTDQQKQVEAILSDTRAHYAAIHAQADPEYEQARQQGRERIRQLLSAEQRPKFEDLLKRIDADRRMRRQRDAR